MPSASRRRRRPSPQNNNAMRLLSRHCAPVDFLVRQQDAAPHGYRGVLACVRITEREREREDSGISPDYDSHSTLTRTTKPSAAVRPSAAEKGGLGVSLDYDTAHHAHAHNKPNAVEKGHSSDGNAAHHATKRQRERLQTASEDLELNSTHWAPRQSQTGTCCATRSCIH
jgi:hypothetical protein